MSTPRHFIAVVTFSALSVLASGCASMIYVPSDEPVADTTGCGGCGDPKPCKHIGPGKTINTHPPWVQVRAKKVTYDLCNEKKGLLSTLLFESTPLGFMAPLFGYPPTDTQYDGVVTLWIAPRDKTRKSFTVAAPGLRRSSADFFKEEVSFMRGKEGRVTILFNTLGETDLRDKGQGTFFSPESVEIRISCGADRCTASAVPPIVSDDGAVDLVPRIKKDKRRLREIEVQRREEKEARKAEQRQEKEARERQQWRKAHPVEARRQDADELLTAIGNCMAAEGKMRLSAQVAQGAVALTGTAPSQRLINNYETAASEGAVKCEMFATEYGDYSEQYGGEGLTYLWRHCEEKYNEQVCAGSRYWIQTHR